MKKNLFIAVFSIISITAIAQKGPKIEFKAKDNTIDYGKVYKDSDNGVRVFEFTNTGGKPLEIAKVEATCGCTAASYPFLLISKGEKSSIKWC